VGLFKSRVGRGTTVRPDVYLEPASEISATNAVGRLLDAQKAEFQRMGMVPLGSSPQSSESESSSHRCPRASTGDYRGPATQSQRPKRDAEYNIAAVSDPRLAGLRYRS
jgi:hypothetical protein